MYPPMYPLPVRASWLPNRLPGTSANEELLQLWKKSEEPLCDGGTNQLLRLLAWLMELGQEPYDSNEGFGTRFWAEVGMANRQKSNVAVTADKLIFIC